MPNERCGDGSKLSHASPGDALSKCYLSLRGQSKQLPNAFFDVALARSQDFACALNTATIVAQLACDIVDAFAGRSPLDLGDKAVVDGGNLDESGCGHVREHVRRTDASVTQPALEDCSLRWFQGWQMVI